MSPSPCPDSNAVLAFLEGAADVHGVESHLAGCSGCRRLVATLAGAPDPAPAAPATLLHRFLVLERKGEGGMGVVYAAYDPKLDRKVALKLLHPRLVGTTPEAALRLEREAQVLARVSHPNVLTVHDVGAVDGGLFIAMELVDGWNLREWLREKSLSPREVLSVFTLAGRGLAAAHAAGIVHRDFKPENVLIGADGRVRVTDFGLAQVAQERGRDAPLAAVPDATGRLTQTGVALGTPAYMAPEQHAGAQTGPAADQFSFCVALYEALCGQRPFEGNSSEELARSAEANAVRAPEVKLPSRVRRALARGLKAAPGERFPSMEALLEALNPPAQGSRRTAVLAAALVGAAAASGVAYWRADRSAPSVCGPSPEPLAVWGPSAREEVQRGLLAVGGASAAQVAERVAASLDRRMAEWAKEHSSACQATRVRGEQSDELLDLRMTCLRERLRETGELVSLLKVADRKAAENAVAAASALPSVSRCADTAALKAVITPALTPEAEEKAGAVRQTLARALAQLRLGRDGESLALARSAADAAAKLRYPALEAEATYLLARTLSANLKGKDARAALLSAYTSALAARHDEIASQAALRYAFETDALDKTPINRELWIEIGAALAGHVHSPETQQMVAAGQGKLLELKGDLQGALEVRKRALEMRERMYGKDDPEVAAALREVARGYLSLQRYEEANGYLQRALTLRTRAFGPDHPGVAWLLMDMGALQRDWGHPDEAEEAQRRAIAIYEQAGPNADLALSLLNFSHDLVDRERCDEANAVSERSMEVARELYGKDHPAVGMAQTFHCGALACLGRLAEAEACFPQSVALLARGGDTQARFSAFSGWAASRERRGQYALARAKYQEALDVFPRASTDSNHQLDAGGARVSIAVCDVELGRSRRAVPELERLLKEPQLPINDALARFTLARALWETGGDRGRARALATEALKYFSQARDTREAAAAERWLKEHPSAN